MNHRSVIRFLLPILAMVSFGGPGLVQSQAAAPVAVTLPATQMLNDAATLNGSVNPGGTDTIAWFEWGTAFGSNHITTATSVGSGTTPVMLTNVLSGLYPGPIYSYRLVVSNSIALSRGEKQTFWTPVLRFNGSNPFTNDCHIPFLDFTTVRAFPVRLVACYYYNLALKADGTVISWGDNRDGQARIPEAATNVVAIAGGQSHCLALRADGSIVGWGENFFGALDIPAAATNVVAIAAEGWYSLILKADGSVLACGSGASVPDGLTNVVAIAAGLGHRLALRADRSIVGWGDNSYGQADTPATATNVVAIAAGYSFSMALKADGTVVAWGDNFAGQTNVPPSATNVIAIAAGGNHALALKANGTVIVWGYDAFGQSTLPYSVTNVVAVAGGGFHNMVLKADGSVICWGNNDHDQTIVPDNKFNLALPIGVAGTVDVNEFGNYGITYSVTNGIGAVATTNRTVMVTDTLPPQLTLIGDNPLQHLVGAAFADPGATASDVCGGNLTSSIVSNIAVNSSSAGSYTNTFTVTDSSGNSASITRIVVVSLAPQTLPASSVVNDAAVLNGIANPFGTQTTAWFEWGPLNYQHTSTAPTFLGNGMSVVALSHNLSGLTPGIHYTYRIATSNSLGVVRGEDQLFWSPAIALNGSSPMTNECFQPFTDPGAAVVMRVRAIAASDRHSIALLGNGSIVGWGMVMHGQASAPAHATNLVTIAAGPYNSLGLRSDGTAVGWGVDWGGAGYVTPPEATNLIAVAIGLEHSIALRRDGAVFAWANGGHNEAGQTIVPPNATNVIAIAAGYAHNLALKADHTVVGWGDNTYNQTNIPSSLTNVVAIAAGDGLSLALRADGTVVGWGRNDWGQATIPTNLNNVVAIAAGGYHGLALKNDGTLVAWGLPFSGQTTIPLGLNNVVAIAAGAWHSVALKADGSVASFGTAGYYENILPAGITNLNLPIGVTGSVNTNVPVNYVLTYTATNELGGVSSVSRTIVLDGHAPLLEVHGDNPLVHALGAPFVDPGATATDSCSGDLTDTIVSNLTVNPNVIGVYTNTFSVVDLSGNMSVAHRIVLVGFPKPVTLEATGVLNDAATLNGSVNPYSEQTFAWFEWGSSEAYGQRSDQIAMGNGINDVTISHNLDELTPGLTYHYRLTASNSVGVVHGVDRIFRSPILLLNGLVSLTNECHQQYSDAGASLRPHPNLSLAAGHYHNLGLRANGTVMGWGLNSSGQTNVPVAASNVVAVAAKGAHSLALRADGTVISWGSNGDGQTKVPPNSGNFKAIAAGYSFSLGLRATGTLLGWGNNSYGQITIPGGATNVVAIDAGDSHSLALRGDGSVIGWGLNDSGQIATPVSATNVVAISAGSAHNLALRTDGTVIGWGFNGWGQVDIPPGATNIVAIAAGGRHSLALRANGSVIGWGDNSLGQVTIPATATNVLAIAAGSLHSVALRADGTIVAWGYNGSGQITVPAGVLAVARPPAVSGISDLNSPGNYTLTFWATNEIGGVGSVTRNVVVVDTLKPSLSLIGNNPIALAPNAPFTDPGASASDLCSGDLSGAISSNITVNPSIAGVYTNTFSVSDASGNQAYVTRTVTVGLPSATTLPATQMLNDTATLNAIVNLNGIGADAWFEWGGSIRYGKTTTPVALSGTNPNQLAAGVTGIPQGSLIHFRVVASNGVGVAYGSDQTFWTPAIGFAGPQPFTNECHVAFVDPGVTVNALPIAIAAGGSHSLGLRADGTVAAWGRNDARTIVPSGASNVLAIAAGDAHSLALRADGTVLSWGLNTSGQTNTPSSATNIIAISAGGSHSLALRGDGKIIGWGSNSSGQTNAPASASDAVAIAAGGSHSLALRRDGTVVSWGSNSSGQTNTPVSASNVVAIAAGRIHSLALRTDRTVVTWGASGAGLGTIPASATNVIAIAAGSDHSFALRDDGTIVAWGSASFGLTTIPISATNVVAISASRQSLSGSCLALKADGTVVGWGFNTFGQVTMPATATVLGLPLTVSGILDVNTPGSYVLNYAATNSLGAGATASRTVVVSDRLPPTLTLLGENPALIFFGDLYTDPGATALDLCGGDLGGTIVSNLTVNIGVAGIYTNSFAVTDVYGNLAQSNRTVIVAEDPQISFATIPESGRFRLEGTGTARVGYTLQISSNLVDWISHTNVVASPERMILHEEDINPAAGPASFYRLKWP